MPDAEAAHGPHYLRPPLAAFGPPQAISFRSEEQAEQSGYGENAVIKMACGKGCSMNGRRDGPEGKEKGHDATFLSRVLIRGPLVSRTQFWLCLGFLLGSVDSAGPCIPEPISPGTLLCRLLCMEFTRYEVHTRAPLRTGIIVEVRKHNVESLCEARFYRSTVLDPAWRVLQYLGTVLCSEI